MKKYVPWNWIITSFVMAVFGIITFWALCSGVNCSSLINGSGSYISFYQDSINAKNEYIKQIQDTLEQRNNEILNLQTTLTKRENYNDKRTLNSLNEKIREKESIIRNKDAEIKRLKEKIEFINSL